MPENKLINLLNNPSFQKLNIALSPGQDFNIFEVLGNAQYEIRHSNLLAWLMNPKENHTLDDIFLKEFWKIIKPDSKFCLDPHSLKIQREFENIDIVIHCPATHTVVAIENKVWSPEGSNQLRSYRQKLSRLYSTNTYQTILIFLTPMGDYHTNDNDHWQQISYTQIYQIIKDLLNKHKFTNPNIPDFLQMYLRTLDKYVLGAENHEETLSRLTDQYKEILTSYKKVDLLLESINKLKTNNTVNDAAIIRLWNYANQIAFTLKNNILKQLNQFPIEDIKQRDRIIFFNTGRLKQFCNTHSISGSMDYYFAFQDDRVEAAIEIKPGYKLPILKKIKQAIKNNILILTSDKINKEYGYLIFYKEILITSDDFKNFSIQELKNLTQKKALQFINISIPKIEKFLLGLEIN